MVQIKVASPTGLFYPTSRKSGGVASLASAAITSSAPIVDCAFEPNRRTDTLFSLASLAADGDERKDLRQRVLPHLVVDLPVPQIGLDPQAPLLRLRREGKRKFAGIAGDRANDDLHGREPTRSLLKIDGAARGPLLKAAAPVRVPEKSGL